MPATITALTRRPGMHHWPAAPASRGYLADPHRHLFVARATVTVDHADRAVEFHDLGDQLDAALASCATAPWGRDGNRLADYGSQSCEQLAWRILQELIDLGHTVEWVSVSEDDEFTATVTPEEQP